MQQKVAPEVHRPTREAGLRDNGGLSPELATRNIDSMFAELDSDLPASRWRIRSLSRWRVCISLSLALSSVAGAATGESPFFQSELIFPAQPQHVHSSSIVECPNGDLLACWFQGSGEKEAADVEIRGARLRKGAREWSASFPMADTPEFPDLNPVLFVDPQGELWMFWIAVLAEKWEDSLLRFRKSKDFLGEGPPRWYWQDDLILKPGDEFARDMERGLVGLSINEADYGEHAPRPDESLVAAAKDLSKRQRGWMTRTHVEVLPKGRWLLPLYSDGYYCGLMAISDDAGKSWRPSHPIVGVALNQPSVVRQRDGTLRAYMRRETPPPRRVQLSESTDNGETWSVAKSVEIPNPNSSLEVIALKDGRWVMVYNDTEKGRDSLALALSDDEGATWKWKRHVEHTLGGRFHYPSLIQAKDGRLHLTYTHQPGDETKRSIKHVELEAAWITPGD